MTGYGGVLHLLSIHLNSRAKKFQGSFCILNRTEICFDVTIRISAVHNNPETQQIGIGSFLIC